MERIVLFHPAFDRRTEGYGIHGVELRMVLKGDKGAVQFLLYTNWHLKHVQDEQDKREGMRFPHLMCHPMPADLGYHSPVPMYEGQSSRDDCPYLDGQPCYYDGSGLNAERIYEALLTRGSDGVWEELEAYYNETFGRRQWDGTLDLNAPLSPHKEVK